MSEVQPQKGSMTRRIIAVIFALCGAITMTYLSLQGISAAFTALVATVSTIVGFYFGARATQA